MKQEGHTRAKQLLVAERVEGISAADRAWLDTHLAACEQCSNEADAIAAMIAAVRSVNITAPDDLVQRTKLAVQRRAEELQAQRESSVLWLSVAMAAIWAILSAPYVWSLFGWMGALSQLTVFLMWWFLPATVLASVAAWRMRQPGWEEL